MAWHGGLLCTLAIHLWKRIKTNFNTVMSDKTCIHTYIIWTMPGFFIIYRYFTVTIFLWVLFPVEWKWNVNFWTQLISENELLFLINQLLEMKFVFSKSSKRKLNVLFRFIIRLRFIYLLLLLGSPSQKQNELFDQFRRRKYRILLP